MTNQNPAEQEASESVDEQRARWEGANFRMTVCANGVVNVQNQNHGECDDPLAHIHSVRVESGRAVGCSCPHATYRDAHCKHQRAVEARPLVVSSATAAGATYEPVATDGGQPVETKDTDGTNPDMRCEECGHEWRESAEGATCPECGSTERRPRRSERADFGGGESTGVVDL